MTAGAIVKPYTHFYPRPPRGGRLTGFPSLCRRMSNFYPRPPRGGRLIVTESIENYFHIISIHALLAEGDARADGQRDRADHFYPRPPRGGRPLTARQILPASDFYPRPPRGGRQEQRCGMILHPIFLSTPSSRRATARGKLRACGRGISIHALLAEGDLDHAAPPSAFLIFLSTPSARRATTFLLNKVEHRLNFYPRPPRGGRPAGLPARKAW